MIDSILKYLSVLTVAGAAISFVFGFIKYLDQRNREERTKRYELFHDLMRRVSAQGEKPGDGLLSRSSSQQSMSYSISKSTLTQRSRFLNTYKRTSLRAKLQSLYLKQSPIPSQSFGSNTSKVRPIHLGSRRIVRQMEQIQQ
ncbi:MAG: hypothetical protein EPN61_05890 [Burkholderiaceae bacterium]|nr:MAG: hypothetical protein EPN61_05890 [Burkholderiaceae bacterium]